MKTLNLVFLITGIALPIVIYLIIKSVNNIPKTSNFYTNRQTTSTYQPISKTEIKKGEERNNLKNILWTLFILSLVIFIGLYVVRGVKKLVEPKKTKAQSEKYDPSVVIITDDIWIEYANLSGITYRLASPKYEFEFLGATEPYCVTNGYGKTYCAQKGEDATNKMVYSRGNNELKFKSQNGKVGRLKLNIIK